MNNNLEELFNLMYFIDPIAWPEPEERAREHRDLNEDAIKRLHESLRPYFIRRTKEILNLPPKNEVIVPISMTSMQRRVYKSILGM
jgi:chromodomain-helicase-DNA-binding protein 4